MICPKCNGKGSVYNALGSFYEDCGHCQGTGMVRVEGEPMTEQEYLQTCNTEQLAEALLNIMANNEFTLYLLHTEKKSVQEMKDAVVEWLKQPHKE